MMERSDNQAITVLTSPLIQIHQTLDELPENSTHHHEKGLIRRKNNEIYCCEVKQQLWLAGPIVVSSLLMYCIQMISVMFVGHMGELALSGASIATSFASVTGLGLLVRSDSVISLIFSQFKVYRFFKKPFM